NLVIKGQDLGVKNLDLDQTEVEIQGQIDLLTYPANRSSDSSRGVWEKIFK
ncbi:MAG: sporulation protein YabP, partial [Peptococcaceae bacterium]|nr:sporulation protein YabP [Peptococcaceae bacterium]